MVPFLRPIAVAGAVAFAFACSDGMGPSRPVVARVALSTIPDTIGVGDTLRITATPQDSTDLALANVRVTWRSLAPTIATIDSAGLITARDSGDAPIVVTAHGRSVVEDTIVARVRWVPRSIALTMPTDSVVVRQAVVRVSAALLDGRGSPVGGRIAWSSSDTAIARVDSTGVVRGINTGTVWIHATSGVASDSVRLRADFARELPGFTGLRTISVGTIVSGASPASVCGLDADGAAHCWHGDAFTRGAGPSPASTTPAAVSGGIRFREVSVGTDDVCGIAVDATLYCWGHNDAGIFATGSNTRPSSDVPVAAAQGLRFTDIDAGDHRGICGIAAADSVVYCWGYDDRAQMGRGWVQSKVIPLGPVVGALKATSVSLGFHHGCAIGVDRATWCWGEVDNFAVATATDQFTVPRIVAAPGTYVSVVAGGENTCGLAADGRASCFGRVGDVITGVPVPVGGELRFAQLVASYVEHEMCGLTVDSALYCWDVYHDPSAPPRRLMSGRTFAAVDMGMSGSFGITTTGEIYRW